MSNKKALRIEQLRSKSPMHSLRRISEIICEEFPDEDQELKGNQMHGQDLCFWAMETLYGEMTDARRMAWDI